MSEFNYILDRIEKSTFTEYPFKFIYIENLFTEKHFREIQYETSSNLGFEFIIFPGGTDVVLRLNTKAGITKEINDLFSGQDFKEVITSKFDISTCNSFYHDGGIQKYLSGYEITPHPDIRRKAFTYMININPEGIDGDIYTHFMKMKPEYEYQYEIWKSIDRKWIEWNRCETVFRHTINNSITMFKPKFNTIHAIKLNYDDSKYRRTQIYGNFWHYK
tara:strand:+ start:416 stop:1069 length:654 start_codon:yes stop_codon:yes gene_type:complete